MLHANEYTPLVSCWVGECVVVLCGLMSCAIVWLLLKATFTNLLFVIFLTCGEEFVKVIHFLFCVEGVGGCGWLIFFCMLCLNFVSK